MLRRVVANFRRQDWTAVGIELTAVVIGVYLVARAATGPAPERIATNAAILRKDPRFVALLQLRIADLATDLGNLTVYCKSELWDPLRGIAKGMP